ncbi:hypothetical protein FOZ70_09295 [Burkholderia sp. COPS]|uniref:hypothetical protein n=1 Tax=unclassified Burkholderia TaxID=2613784 RepID=UPI001CA5A0ED|nr:hypothetical protein [Burkholderia sp. COPS]MBW5804940.1 hypothetical protein [Burkholderia sp. COPS]
MLFYLTESLEAVVQKNPGALQDFVEDLFSARRRGRHIIYASEKTLDTLWSIPGLSDRAKQTISSVKSRQRGKRALFKSVPGYIEVVSDGDWRKQVVGSQIVVRVPLSMLNKDTLFNDPVLLVENESDGQFFKLIGEYLESRRCVSGGLKLAFDVQAAGGSETPKKYKKLKDEKRRFVLCVVDSDKDHPGAALGANVAAPIFEHERDSISPFSDVKILECYSIENIVPPSLIHEAQAKKGVNVEGVRWFKDASTLASIPAGAYAPLKGPLKCSILKVADSKGGYWIENINSLEKKDEVCKHWGEWHRCKNTCNLYEPIGKKTLVEVLSLFDEDEAKRRAQYEHSLTSIPSRIMSEWKEVGAYIVRWGCAGGRLSLA